MNNLYIIEEVLCCYAGGMVVIAAPSLERCRELFLDKFVREYYRDSSCETAQEMREFDAAIKNGDYKVIENVNHDEGIISFLHGSS